MPRRWPWSLLLLLAAAAADYPACKEEFVRHIFHNMKSHCAATHCPDATWKDRFVMSKTIQEGTDRVTIFDIGCNKALDALSTITVYSQNYSITKKMWFEKGGWKSCGACQQCKGEPPQFPGAKPKAVDLYCFEPLPSNFVRIAANTEAFGMRERGMRTINAAFTSVKDALHRHWTSEFPVGDEKFDAGGHEAIGIEVRPVCRDCSTVPVLTFALDPFVALHGIKTIDILSIDTEGNDPFVLEGSEDILPHVRYVEFEYHNRGVWGQTDVETVLQKLEHIGFVCYWIGRAKVWRITDCWHKKYTQKCWSNIGCVQRNLTEWYEIMEDVFNETVPH